MTPVAQRHPWIGTEVVPEAKHAGRVDSCHAAWTSVTGRDAVLDVGLVLLTQQEAEPRSAEGDGLFDCSGGQVFWHVEDEHNLGSAVRPRHDGTGRHCTDVRAGQKLPTRSTYGVEVCCDGSISGGAAISLAKLFVKT